MNVKIFVEGGGDSKEQILGCREGFRKLIEKAGFARPKSPSITACGGRGRAYDKFKTAVTVGGEYALLLVDSEDPVKNADESPDADAPWKHLKVRDGWEQPAGANNDQAQLMATCMETWIVTDQTALAEFFGQHFQRTALPPLPQIEQQSRQKVQQTLEHATRNCGKDRRYAKGKKSFEVLAALDPAVLEKHLPHFRRLVATLRRNL